MVQKLLPPMAYVIKKNREKLFFGHGGIQECADTLGIHRQMLTKWESGETKPSRANMKKLATVFSLTLKEFMEQVNQAPGNPLPPPNIDGDVVGRQVVRIDSIVDFGVAAADETAGARPGVMYEDNDEQPEEIGRPGQVIAMKVKGESMSPVLLPGQYVMVGPEIINDRVRDGDIVVAKVRVESGLASNGQETEDARWEGVYCKRVYDGGDVWVFKSISEKGSSPFSVYKGFCRLWPMVGSWFDGHGRAPRED